MKPRLKLAVLAAALAASCSSNKPCPGDAPHDELLGLNPLQRVTFDGAPLQRSGNGRYQTDAGHEFDIEPVFVESIDPRTECFNVADSVTLSLRNPFTGVEVKLEAAR